MESPFRVSPNPNLLYVTNGLRSSIDKIRFAIDERQGLSLVLADVGMGKTSVLRYLMAEYGADSERYTTGLLIHTEFPTRYAFLKSICAQFQLEPKRSQSLSHDALEEWLFTEFKAGRTVILFIDEGQRLTAEMLEVIRSLLNFETNDAKLLQIIVAGTLELRDRILAKKNRALRSRIFAPCLLIPLAEEEMTAMIALRCERARVSNPFDQEACRRIYYHSKGVPRHTLIICSHAWDMAKRLKVKQVTPEMIDAAAGAATVAEEEEEEKAEAVAK